MNGLAEATLNRYLTRASSRDLLSFMEPTADTNIQAAARAAEAADRRVLDAVKPYGRGTARDVIGRAPVPRLAPVAHYAWVTIGLPTDEATSAAFVGAQVKVTYTTNASLAIKVNELVLAWDLRTDDLVSLIADGPSDWGGPLMRDNGFTRERSGLVITTVPCDSRGNNVDAAPNEPTGE